MNIPSGSAGKESACSAGDLSLMPGSGKSPGEGNSNPPHYSCLENPMGRKVRQATIYGLTRVEHDYAKLTLFFFFFTFHGGGSGEVRIIFPEERTIHKENTLFEDES